MSGEKEPSDLDWIQLRKDMTNVQVETSKEKFTRKFTENPFVPLGCLATAAALSFGLWSFRTGRTKLSQQMMRVRIAAQGLTIAALVVGVMMTAGKNVK